LKTDVYQTRAALVLASASPRRRELLTRMGLRYEPRSSDLQESKDLGLAPEALARHWARAKAEAVAGGDGPGALAWYLGVDTIVVIDERVLGKPGSREEAREFLTRLAGRWHVVITAYCLLHPAAGRRVERAVHSRVKIKALTAAEIEAYLDTDEPYDKAGAYAVQGLGAFMVEAIEGSYTNVVGLPLAEVVDDLRDCGVIEIATHTART
jgi:septum formation protein